MKNLSLLLLVFISSLILDEIIESFLNAIIQEHMAFQISTEANNIFDEIFTIKKFNKVVLQIRFSILWQLCIPCYSGTFSQS